jgi:hypothetical protein
MAARCSSSVMEASQCAENGLPEIVNIDRDLDVVLLLLFAEDAEVASQVDQGGALVVQLECDALASGDVCDRHAVNPVRSARLVWERRAQGGPLARSPDRPMQRTRTSAAHQAGWRGRRAADVRAASIRQRRTDPRRTVPAGLRPW